MNILLKALLSPQTSAWQVNVRPSVFAYAAPLTAEAAAEVKKVEKAVLSTTARAKAKAKEKQAGKGKADNGELRDANGQGPSVSPQTAVVVLLLVTAYCSPPSNTRRPAPQRGCHFTPFQLSNRRIC